LPPRHQERQEGQTKAFNGEKQREPRSKNSLGFQNPEKWFFFGVSVAISDLILSLV